DLVLVREVVVERRTGEPERAGDVVERGGRDPAAHEQRCGRLEDGLAPHFPPLLAAFLADKPSRRRRRGPAAVACGTPALPVGTLHGVPAAPALDRAGGG